MAAHQGKPGTVDAPGMPDPLSYISGTKSLCGRELMLDDITTFGVRLGALMAAAVIGAPSRC
jgi:hypothetical protein